MEESRRNHNKDFQSLVDLGTKGFFPLFYSTWIQDAKESSSQKLTSHEKRKAKIIMEKLQKHRSIERKKTLLLALDSEERNYFIKVFLKMVEGKILDEKPEFH